MAKVALLIGVSEYGAGLNQLPKALEDIKAMKMVLQQSELGGFAEVKVLSNPDTMMMQLDIERLFADRARDDLVLLFFSGHGVKDDSGNLYFATSITRKNAEGELLKSTAVPATFVHDIMSNSRSRRQVIILDCCFSGAFAKGLAAKDDGVVNIKEQLGGEGRVVLTSSASTEYSFENAAADLSVYTRYLVEGLRSGAADEDSDGYISVEELHEYAKRKVHEAAPAMKPKIYAVEEGFRILLSQSPRSDPGLVYRKEVEHLTSRGQISNIGRCILDELRVKLGLSAAVAAKIEAEVSHPYQEYEEKLQAYAQALTEATQREAPLSDYTWEELNRYQQVLGLRDADIVPIKAKILPGGTAAGMAAVPPVVTPSQSSATLETAPKSVPSAPQPPLAVPRSPQAAITTASGPPPQTFDPLRWSLMIIGIALLAGLGGFWSVSTWIDSPTPDRDMTDLNPSPRDVSTNGAKDSISNSQIESRSQALHNRRKALGIEKTFFTQLVDDSFYAKYPEWQNRTLSDSSTDAIWRDRWNTIADSWLTTLETHLSTTARARLGAYTVAEAGQRAEEVERQYHLSHRALNDLVDANFLHLFPGLDKSIMDDADQFIRTNMGQIWHALATDTLQAIRDGSNLQELSFNGTDFLQKGGQLAPGEGYAYIFQLSQGQQLSVDVDVPPRATQISVYPPKLQTAPPILEDATATHTVAQLTQDGFYEFVIISTSETPFEYTVSFQVE